MATDFGTDFAGVWDLDFDLTVVSGRRVVAECVAKRWITLPGTLVYDKRVGVGLMSYLEATEQEIAGLPLKLEAEALEDDRVRACTVTVTLTDGVLVVDGQLEDADGAFPLTLTVDGVTVQLLAEESTS